MTATTTAPQPTTSDEAITTSESSFQASPRSEQPPRPSAGAQPKLPRIVRPQALARATRPANIPTPEHHHLPGWVRRIHGQASPVLADIAGNLEGDVRTRYEGAIAELITQISAGKFSLAWHYPRLIDDGMGLYQRCRRESEEAAKQRRALDTVRRRVSDTIRDNTSRLPGDASARLQRNLRNAATAEEIRAVELEVEQSLTSARSVEERRRDREIDRTRQRIRQALPRGAEAATAAPAESWQDVLRRIADQYAE